MGVIQFLLVIRPSMYNAFLVSVLPFILVGIIKLVLATIIGYMLRNHKSIMRMISYDKA